MSGTGNKSLKRTDTSDSRVLTQGVKSLVFCHSATAGETGINFSSLTWSSQDQSDSGIVNPTSAEILSSNLMFYKSNLEVMSSARGVLAPTSYRVTNGALIWNGFTSLALEKFFISVRNVVRTANYFADAQPLYESGLIAEGQTEFDFIRQVKIPNDTSYQPIMVSIDGETVDPNTANSSVTTDGMYYIKDLGNGYGRSIKLNSPAPVGGYQVQVWGTLVYKPDNSLLQQVQTLGTQLDLVIPDLALATGNAESKYRSAVNDVDLAYFSGIVNKILDTTVVTDIKSETWAVIQAINVVTDKLQEVEFNFAGAATVLKGSSVSTFSALQNSTNLVYAVDDSANTRTKFLASERISLNIAFTGAGTVGSDVVIYKNGISGYRLSSVNINALGYNTQSSANIELEAGEFFTVALHDNTTSTNNYVLSFKATALPTKKTIRSLIGE